MTTTHLKLRSPLGDESHNFYVLIETSGSMMAHDEEKLSLFTENLLRDNIIDNGTMTNDPGKINVRIIFSFFKLLPE